MVIITIINNVAYMAQCTCSKINVPYQLLHALQPMSSEMFSGVCETNSNMSTV